MKAAPLGATQASLARIGEKNNRCIPFLSFFEGNSFAIN